MNIRSMTSEEFLALGNLGQLEILAKTLRPLAKDLAKDRNAVLGEYPRVQDSAPSFTVAREEDRGVIVGASGISAGYVLIMRATAELYGAPTGGIFDARSASWTLSAPLRPVELGAACAWVRASTAYAQVERLLFYKGGQEARFFQAWANVVRGLQILREGGAS